jgi:hypothetical protein
MKHNNNLNGDQTLLSGSAVMRVNARGILDPDG